jgi:hypothetical protein
MNQETREGIIKTIGDMNERQLLQEIFNCPHYLTNEYKDIGNVLKSRYVEILQDSMACEYCGSQISKTYFWAF